MLCCHFPCKGSIVHTDAAQQSIRYEQLSLFNVVDFSGAARYHAAPEQSNTLNELSVLSVDIGCITA